jgi:FMN-dependent NADH-azoreductase
MKKILHIISSPRGEASISIKLGNAIVEKIKAAYPGSVVKERNLSKNRFPHLEEEQINSFFTPAENRSPQQAAAVNISDSAIAELQEADIIVIGAPMYSFTIPSTLNAYFDHIARPGITFRYTENGPEGFLKNKKAYIVTASGGVYSEGVMQDYDFVVPYVQKILAFVGITDVTVYRAEGLNVPLLKDTTVEKALERIAIA